MDPIRDKCRNLLLQALKLGGVSSTGKSEEDLKNLAGSIEDELYKVNGEKVSQAYKESVRSHVFNLKDTSNPLRQKVLSGEIVPKEFAVMTSDDMAGPERRLLNEQLRRKSIVDSMGYEDIRPRHRNADNPDEDRD